jgi:DNA-binding response OmpR family regulator
MTDGGAIHVLVTEDDADLRGALVELLDSEGIASTCVSTIDETRRALALTPQAVLLLDLNFRGTQLTAIDWLSDFDAQKDAPRTLLLSASAQGRAVAERFGVTFIAKPFDFDELLAHLHRVNASSERPRDTLTGNS